MDYSIFIEKVKAQDERNIFGIPKLDYIHMLPEAIKSFYQYTNPIDVEVVLNNLCSIKLYSVDELSDLQTQYNLNDDNFVFATMEGDPIFLSKRKIYAAPHGIGEWIPELLAENFDEFLIYIINEMKV